MTFSCMTIIGGALAGEVLFGKMVHGGRVTIDLDEHEKISLKFEEAATAPTIPSAI